MVSDRICTYTIPLILQREDMVLQCGFCLSGKDFDALKSERHDFLHPKENNCFDSLRYPKRQHSYLLGRYCAKRAISALLSQCDYKNICIDNGIFQQPIVQHPQHSNIQVSISHTDYFGVALAFPEMHPMAIDIETIGINKISTIQTQLTANEQKLWDVAPERQAIQFTSFWTIKEALSKILRCGFMVPFEILEISTQIYYEHNMMSEFKNFFQYKALSFIFANTACSLVYPKKTQLILDVTYIKKIFDEKNNA